MIDLMAIVCDVLADFNARIKRGFPVQLAAAMIDRDFDRELGRRTEMDWLGWAVPAIMTELAIHHPIPCADGGWRCESCDHPGFIDDQEWREHVAPLIARRIGCDPRRAATALTRYIPDKV